MADEERPQLGEDTQDGLLALLCYSKSHGAQVAAQLQTEHFDGVHREIAAAVFDYRRKYHGKPPGRRQMPMIVERMPVQHERHKAIALKAAQLPKVLKSLNRDYTVSLGLQFAKRQGFKAGVLKAAEILTKPTSDLDEVERILHQTIRIQPQVISTGITLSDIDQSLQWLKKKDSGLKFGFPSVTNCLLDKLGVSLKPKTMTLYLGAKNTGKSWFCIHTARSCIMQGAKVLHITLEMSEEQCAMRYHQSWLGISLRDAKYMRTFIERDKFGRAVGWQPKERKARYTAQDTKLEDVIIKATDKWAFKWNRMKVQAFPTGSLIATQLENHLDALASNEEPFQPDVLIVDYPDLMKVDTRTYRLDLGEIYIALRGLAVRRNLALVCPSQVNRAGFNTKKVRSTHAAEDIRKVGIADTVLTYSQTATEKKYHLARLTVEHSRDSEIGMELVLAQSYTVGQYVVDAVLMGDEYRARMDDESKKDDAPVEEEDVGDDEPSMIR
jgi:hypothetical protein